MKKEFNYQEIEDYVNGKLDAKARQELEAKMEADQALADEVALYQRISEVTEVMADEKLQELIATTDGELEQSGFFSQDSNAGAVSDEEAGSLQSGARIIPMGIRRALAIAVSVLVLFAFSWWWAQNNYSNNALSENYFSETISTTFTRAAGGTEDPFEPGLSLIEKKDFGAAGVFFEAIGASDPGYVEARLYLALSQYYEGNFSGAINNAQIVAESNSRFKEKAQWLQLNAKLAAGNTDVGFEGLLREMAENCPDPFFKAKALELQKDYTSFWRKLTVE